MRRLSILTLTLALSQNACVVTGYRSDGSFFFWPGGVLVPALIFLLVLLVRRRRR